MSTYWAILEKMRGSKLRLTKMDDEIYEHFKKEFPEFDPRDTIDEDKMKSKEGKERWRNFMMTYEKKVDDYNFGTMLRANPKFEYGEKETIFGLSVTFIWWYRVLTSCPSYAHAILRNRDCKVFFSPDNLHGLYLIRTRNREGLNDWVYEREHPDEEKAETS